MVSNIYAIFLQLFEPICIFHINFNPLISIPYIYLLIPIPFPSDLSSFSGGIEINKNF